MESFICSPTGKKLPGKHGQQDLIAAPTGRLPDTQDVEKYLISRLARVSL
jgi:hypothetical protein